MVTLYSGTGSRIDIGTAGSETAFTPWDDVLHRGWHEGVPDNTLPAYYLMKQNGYFWGECDVRISSDGIPVLCHDGTVTGTLNGTSTTLTVEESTAAEITSLVLKTHDTFGDIHPCTLEQLLELAKIIDIGIVIDFKSCAAFYSEPGATAVANTVVRCCCSDRVVYMPIIVNNAKWIQAIDRNASFDFVTSIWDSNKESFISGLESYKELLTGANTVGFDLNASAWGGEDVIQAIHEAGMNVSFWGVGNTEYFQYSPLRVTYNGYGNAYLGRNYILEKQAALAAKYPLG